MTNLERLKMEIEGIAFDDNKLNVYLQENELNATVEYAPTSKTNKKNILKTALSILESIANNPSNMKSYKTDDISISQFSENLNNRIDALDRKIRLIPDDEGYNDGASFVYMFK
jgi:hypothetical protein